ncbi:MAG: aminotransferase class IV [Opitutus sp.]|nr:aminotransferase class IV [Opitutus sp.]MCS6245893.1 aminotransferase class IV [Opitutus sp.]MCS6275469.1 aminotransferase class IV [Opitutus sp.]MCS6276028.1 aminotransferase class IV [Opitutus sp.]MCS6301123.1 aminotransferase class IV [Opitutus sp.]
MNTSHYVLLDNVLQPGIAARVPALSEGFLYGHGVFETIKVRGAHPAFLADHHARLTASARALDLPYALDLGTLRDRLHRVIVANHLADGSAKVVLFHNETAPTSELICTSEKVYPADTYARGFRLRTVFSGERTGTLSEYKTLNYLVNIRAKRAAMAAGFDEPLFITPAGIVIEGATTNVFAVRGGVALTPALACGPLPGTARARVLALLGPERVREGFLTRTELDHADEIFVTNALLGVMPVCRCDDRALDLKRTPFTSALSEAYHALEAQSL